MNLLNPHHLVRIAATAVISGALLVPLASGAKPSSGVAKGTYTGTYYSTAGHGSGSFSLKITSEKQVGGGYQLKGSGKLGTISGPYAGGYGTSGGIVAITGAIGPRSLKASNAVIQLNRVEDGPTWAGFYTVAKLLPGSQPVDQGTLTVTKQ